jgi:hypothetical protein
MCTECPPMVTIQPGGKLYVLGAEKIIPNLLGQPGKDHDVIL